MKTIKEKVLTAISKKGTMPRKEVVYEVLKANGTFKGSFNPNDTEFNKMFRGYYSINFQQWELEGLIERKKGIYSITELGKKYLKNPSIIRQINKDRRQKAKIQNANIRKSLVEDAIGYFYAVGTEHLSSDERYYIAVFIDTLKKYYL